MLRLNKSIYRMPPAQPVPRRHRRPRQRTKGPMILRISLRQLVVRSHRPSINPVSQDLNLPRIKKFAFMLRRHPLVLVARHHPRHQQTASRIARYDRRPRITPSKNHSSRVQSQATFLLQRPMTRITPLPQQRLHLPHILNLRPHTPTRGRYSR